MPAESKARPHANNSTRQTTDTVKSIFPMGF